MFQIIDDWYDENHELDTDMLDTMLRLFMAPLSTHRSYSLSVREAIIIRSLFIDMCALTFPNLRKLLQPLHWFRTKRSIFIDLEDSTSFKHISVRKSISSELQLCDISSSCSSNSPVDFPVFGSATIRRKDPVLQAAATAFINSILAKYPNQHFLWSDGAYSRFKRYASTAILITINDEICHSSSITINTTNIATAELCGIVMNLTWLLQCSEPLPSVHIMCDNQYSIKICLKQCQSHPLHMPLVAAIHRTVQTLKPVTTIHFHWIPGHTDNKFHCQVDTAASQALQLYSTHTLTLHKLLHNITDALASGGVHNP